MSDPVRLQVADGVAEVLLNRPDAANAIDLPTARALRDVANTCAADPAIRCVLLHGAGRMFCGGGDLRAFADQDDLPGHLVEVTQHLHAAITRFARMDAPLVAAVHGSAAGAGFSLACSADLLLAGESARFVAAYSRVGLSPDGSLSHALPRLVGVGRALDLLLRNQALTAEQAHQWGIVTQVVPDADLLDRARNLARELAAGAAGSHAAIRRLVRDSWNTSLETQLAAETAALEATAGTADAREGIDAFLGKRPPAFGDTHGPQRED